MNSEDMIIREAAEAFVPEPSAEYGSMVTDTVSRLRAKTKARPSAGRTVWRTLSAAAAAFASLFVIAFAVFAARPALAADVPVVNSIVYAAAPKTEASEAERESIRALITDVFRAFAARDYESAEACFREGAMHSREAYLAAAYTDQTLEFYDSLPDNAKVGDIEISGLASERKAFRYSCRVTLNVLPRDGSDPHQEDCFVLIRENADGMCVESIMMQSASYRAFAEKYEEVLGAVPEEGASFDLIPIACRCLYFDAVNANRTSPREREDYYGHMLRTLDGISAPDEDKAALYTLIGAELHRAAGEITPAMVTIEDAAAELMYRYWLSGRTLEVSDFSDILEHNEATDLFLWDAKLRAEALIPGVYGRLDTVERGHAEIRDLTENPDGTVTAHLFVQTEISAGIMRGVGEDIVLTLRSEENGYKIVGFDREVGDGIYVYTLKPLAEKYKAEGYSWQDAGRMAYEGSLAVLG